VSIIDIRFHVLVVGSMIIMFTALGGSDRNPIFVEHFEIYLDMEY
jgi:hypothetical protein